MSLRKLLGKPRSKTVEPDDAWLRGAQPAISVLKPLHNAGHQAYLVGGCVRDLLLRQPPKDFDIATNATPAQIRKLFRRSRLVGRRFPIVLVRTGERGRSIEVTTFRAPATRAMQRGATVRDDRYGNIRQDATRRDLSVNALYFDVRDCRVIDYCGGIEDIDGKCARIIGKPQERFREDPARILRTIRLAARLDLTIAPGTLAALKESPQLLRQVQPARMFDEFAKTLLQVHNRQSWAMLREYGLLEHLLPPLAELLGQRDGERAERMIQHTLRETERYLLSSGGKLNQSLLYAALLWPVLYRHKHYSDERTGELLRQIAPHITVPGYYRRQLLDIWRLQPRLERRRNPEQVAQSPGFRPALRLLEFRTSVQSELHESVKWWRARSEGLPRTAPGKRRPPRTRRRRARKPASAARSD